MDRDTSVDGGDGLRALRFREGDREPERVAIDGLLPAADDDREILWVDIPRPTDAVVRGLDTALRLDGTLERALHDDAAVRFEERSLRMIATGLRHGDGHGPAERVTLRLVAARNLVVSMHDDDLPWLDEPVRIVASDPRFGRLDAGTFLGLLLDGVLDGYFREVERIERVIDAVDEMALKSRNSEPLLDRLVELRHRIATVRRALAPQREVFAALVRPVDPVADSPIGWPWPGLPVRLERALDAVEHAREQLLGSFDLVSTRTAERTNDVMRLLTVVSGLLLPSVVIAGVMGMNFKQPFFDDPSNFILVVGAMLGLSLAILVIARWRRWI